VIEAASGSEALELAAQYDGRIHLVVTDLVMTQIDGPELVKRLEQTRPKIRVIYMSGYTDESVVRHGMLQDDAAFLQKPFTPDALGRKVREVLSAKEPSTLTRAN
jgi:DNA-binding NtrC family response regulator